MNTPQSEVAALRWLLLSLVIIPLLLPTAPASAKIYKYQRDGVWYYTDSPPPDMPKTREEIEDSGQIAPSPTQAGTRLLQDYPVRNAIEKAAAATVAIKTAMGYGSGFFVSTHGHIITNKHVVRTSEQQTRKINEFFDRTDHRAEDIEKQLENEQNRIEGYKGKLERLKQMAENEKDRSRKQSYEDEYRYRKQEYEDWKSNFENRKKEFKDHLRQYESGREDYDYSRSVADLAQSFTIVLVDDTELYARLVAVSEKHDLALLKLDGYQTPSLKPAKPHQLAQGDPVYAIGNPAQLRNTVTSGIFSGYEDSFIQTNAQINPGNSGGPLIDPDGNVIGVNTKKKIGSALEGLGFAIPIQIALEEFGPHLPQN
jgi:serine protease Do